MKVAITGAEGFLGRAVVKLLENKEIYYTVFDNKKHNLFKPKTLKSLISEVDIVIHLAAVNRGGSLELFKTNVLGTMSLLEAMTQYCPNARIIFSSSFQVYLKNVLYGSSKKTAEELIALYTDKSQLKGTILRISNIYGPSGKPFYNSVIATFIHLIKKADPLKINGDGSARRDFIYVDDVAEAIIKACLYQQRRKVEIIDICSGIETSLNEIIQIVKKTSGKKFEVVYNKAIKENSWPTKDKNFNKAYQLLDWKPSISITEGLKKVMTYEYKD